MNDVVSHKCPNCDGPLLFDPEKQQFHCEYCLSKFTEQDILTDQFAEKQENLQETKEKTFNLYHCPSCGGEVVTNDTTAATFCYYCHNPVVLTDRITGDFLPNAILPFKISKDDAQKKFLNWAKGKKFIPSGFFNKQQIEKLTGVYFPYWNVDATTKGKATAKATKIDIWRVGETEYTRTRRYDIIRNGTISFKALLKNALSKNDKQNMIESVQPFPVEDVQEFHSQFLSGFQAEKRDIEFTSLHQEVNEELSHFTKDVLLNDVYGYTSVTRQQSKTKIIDQSNLYLLLPLWLITYQDTKTKKVYYYAMNGATGKVSGILPIKKSKLFSYALLIGAALAGLLLAGGYLIF
ncbi:TFIIB-type zinc ribbon-containing protein [Vagococcus sp.]|uniref:TFIIB-type zinc ribbon-containing protein n=1 Tax=Vagococcus sp. TaxID=1933889 RepID=UPI003F99F997